ncbi:MAG TPA: site-specific integrase [Nitrososphaeraceae archaeon]
MSEPRLLRQEQQDEDQAYFNFINSIKSEATKSVYQTYLKNFMDYCGLAKLCDLLKLDVQNSIIKYLIALREKGLSSNSISVRLNAIFHFYEMNDVVLNVINYL